MTYGYRYHGKDGSVKCGEIDAPSREDAFQSLRRDGIKPMQFWTVEETAGAIHHFGKRGVAIVVLSLALAVAVVSLFRLSRPSRVNSVSQFNAERPGARHLALPAPRKQFEKFPTNVVTIFRHPSECYLARYAQPGLLQSHEKDGVTLESLVDDLYEALDEPIWIESGDDASVAELKRIVAGLKEDARKFLNTANGVLKLKVWLDERQRMESDYCTKIQAGSGTREEKAEKLKAIGFL